MVLLRSYNLPVVRGKSPFLQHCVRCNEQKGRVCDGIFPCSSLQFFLVGLESVYVLEGAITIDVVFLNFILQSQDVDHMQSTTDFLEVGE